MCVKGAFCFCCLLLAQVRAVGPLRQALKGVVCIVPSIRRHGAGGFVLFYHDVPFEMMIGKNL